MNQQSFIYLPKKLREMGFNDVVSIIPNKYAAVMFPAGTDLSVVVVSMRIILQEIEHEIANR